MEDEDPEIDLVEEPTAPLKSNVQVAKICKKWSHKMVAEVSRVG